ncbi:FAD binding domain-containing protein [Bacteroidota bacterium]
MIPNLEILKPKSIKKVLEILDSNRDNAKILAGGTDIIPAFHIKSQRLRKVKLLIDVNDIQELKVIKKNDESVIVGSCLTFSEIIQNKYLNKKYPLLVKAAKCIGSNQIRNRATIGGNFINNAPCADSVPPLLVYNARLKIVSPAGEREILLENFLKSPYKTKLKTNELVVKIILPKINKDYKGDFNKLGRRRGVAISRITLAGLAKINNSKIIDLRLASGAVTPMGIRFHGIEKRYINKRIEPEFYAEISREVGRNILEVTGIRYSTPYKVPVTQQLCYQLLNKILS